MTLTRRDFIKANAAAAAATAAAVNLPLVPSMAQAATTDPATAGADIKWDKAACRFCGTGCSVLVGTKGGRVVATQGDPDAPVNRGLNCIKGYFLSKIMYGRDRLTTPLLRKKLASQRHWRQSASGRKRRGPSFCSSHCKATAVANSSESANVKSSLEAMYWQCRRQFAPCLKLPVRIPSAPPPWPLPHRFCPNPISIWCGLTAK